MTAARMLWHFTCDHAAEDLGRRGTLNPAPQPFLHDVELVWLTDDPDATRDDLGLTSQTLDCDRMDNRYRVTDVRRCVPWAEWWPDHVPPDRARDLMIGRDARSWWVSEHNVPVVRA